MKSAVPKRGKLSKRLNSMVAPDSPLRDLVGNLSKVARYARAEANSLSVEKIDIRLERLPKKLEGFRLVHLSDIHHSPFTNLEHISRAVEVSNRLKPDMFVLTGDYVSHESEYIAPVAEGFGQSRMPNSEHTPVSAITIIGRIAELVTDSFRAANINVLINDRFSFEGGRRFVLAVGRGRLYGRENRCGGRDARVISR